MKLHLPPWILGALLFLCSSGASAQSGAAASSTAAEPTAALTPSAASAAIESTVIPSAVVPSSSASSLVAATLSATSGGTVAIRSVKATASSTAASPEATETVSASDSDISPTSSSVNIFGLKLGIIPLVAIILGLAFIVLYIVMRCMLRRRKLEVRRMRESFSELRTRFNRTVLPKPAAVIPEDRSTPNQRKMPASASTAQLHPHYPQMSQNDSNGSLNWTPPTEPSTSFGDSRFIAEQGYQRQIYQSNHLSQPRPVHQKQSQQQYAYYPKIDGMYGVVDGYYGYNHGDVGYIEHHPSAPNPYTNPQVYLSEASDGAYHMNMDHRDHSTPSQHYQNDNNGVYANVNYYADGAQYPHRSSTAQHYDPGMLRTRRSSRGARPAPYSVPQSESPVPTTYLNMDGPRELRAVNCASPTSTSDASKLGDDSAV